MKIKRIAAAAGLSTLAFLLPTAVGGPAEAVTAGCEVKTGTYEPGGKIIVWDSAGFTGKRALCEGEAAASYSSVATTFPVRSARNTTRNACYVLHAGPVAPWGTQSHDEGMVAHLGPGESWDGTGGAAVTSLSWEDCNALTSAVDHILAKG